MTIIHFVRHGETVWHHDNRYAGVSDVALTPRGLDQAQALAEWAATQDISSIVSSDLSRARITAAPAAAALGLAPVVDARLREVDFGGGEGLTAGELREQHPEAWRAFEAAPATSPLPGGEPGAAAVARASTALAELSGTVLVVAHNTLGRLVLCHALGIALDRYRDVFPAVLNGAVTTFEIPPGASDFAGRARLLRFNERTRAPVER